MKSSWSYIFFNPIDLHKSNELVTDPPRETNPSPLPPPALNFQGDAHQNSQVLPQSPPPSPPATERRVVTPEE